MELLVGKLLERVLGLVFVVEETRLADVLVFEVGGASLIEVKLGFVRPLLRRVLLVDGGR